MPYPYLPARGPGVSLGQDVVPSLSDNSPLHMSLALVIYPHPRLKTPAEIAFRLSLG